jgi:hypothetical protein
MTDQPLASRRADLEHARHHLNVFCDALDYATRDRRDGEVIGDPDPALSESLDPLSRALCELYDRLDELDALMARDGRETATLLLQQRDEPPPTR